MTRPLMSGPPTWRLVLVLGVLVIILTVGFIADRVLHIIDGSPCSVEVIMEDPPEVIAARAHLATIKAQPVSDHGTADVAAAREFFNASVVAAEPRLVESCTA